MADRILTLTITIPESSEDVLDGVSASLDAQGVSEENVVPLLLHLAECFAQQEIRDNLERSHPLTSSDQLDAIAFLNSRLRVVDTIMHLPEPRPEIAVVTL